MRRKLLSFIIIFSAVVTAIAVHRGITRLDGDGTAQASLGAMSAPVGEARSAARRSLAKDISLHPERMLDIRGQDIKAVLREPELIRQESPTTIWQYRTEACVLDIYFSGNTDPLLLPVAHYEIRARGKGVEDAKVADTCVRELARKSGRPRMVDVSKLYKQN
jgi:hypothetical protein